MALESALSDFIHTRWEKEEVSKSRIEDFDSEVNLSLMLNIELTALAPKDNKPPSKMVGGLNRARKLRNNIIHNKGTLGYSDAAESLQCVKQLLDYLAGLKRYNSE